MAKLTMTVFVHDSQAAEARKIMTDCINQGLRKLHGLQSATVEAWTVGIVRHMSEPDKQKIRDLCKIGRIPAIKEVRRMTGCGLREGKDIVEQICD